MAGSGNIFIILITEPDPATSAGIRNMDITPLIPKGRQIINAYGNGGFTIAGERWSGSVLVLPEQTTLLDISSLLEIDAAILTVLKQERIELLLVGCGSRISPIPSVLRDTLRASDTGIDAMDTGAACRTFNILLAEERRVGALLIAV